MAFTKAKADKMLNVLYTVMDDLDPSGRNTTYYKKLFQNMPLNKMDKFFKNFFADPEANWNLSVQHYENDLTIENIKKAAEFLGIPLFERVALPYTSKDTGDLYWTQEPVPVLYVHVKRVEQLVTKKNSMSIGITQRNTKTGQVTGDDKNGRMSDMENIAITTLGSDELLKEMLGARADDMYMKREMLKQIQNDGYVDMDKIQSLPQNKVALNTLDVYFTAIGIKTNIVTDGLILKRTLQNLNRDNSSVSSKGQKDF